MVDPVIVPPLPPLELVVNRRCRPKIGWIQKTIMLKKEEIRREFRIYPILVEDKK